MQAYHRFQRNTVLSAMALQDAWNNKTPRKPKLEGVLVLIRLKVRPADAASQERAIRENALDMPLMV